MSDVGFVDMDAGRLFYVREGTGPAVVLAHGAPTLDHRMWAGQAAAWSEGFTVVRYDLRGYGRSSIPEAPYRHCDDLAALVAALDLGTVVTGGNSFGATRKPDGDPQPLALRVMWGLRRSDSGWRIIRQVGTPKPTT